MACYTMRTYEERTIIQKMWNDGAQAKEIADKLEAPLSTIYSELRRGQDGSRLQNQRLRYNADLAPFSSLLSGADAGPGSGKERKEHEEL